MKETSTSSQPRMLGCDNKELRLGDRLEDGEGGGGRVYALVDKPNMLVKEFHDPGAAEVLVTEMLVWWDYRDWLAGPWPLVTWPTEAVRYAESKRFAGYAMVRLAQPPFWPLDRMIGVASRRPPEFGVVTWGFLLKVAASLADLTARVHGRGLSIGDLSGCNFFVTPEARVALVDSDNCRPLVPSQAARFPPPVFAPNHRAPEVLSGSQVYATEATDDFALAVLVCRMLMLGEHPFGGYPNDDYEERDEDDNIREGRCRLLQWDQMRSSSSAPPPSILPNSIRGLVSGAFAGDSLEHPERRPKAREWASALRKGSSELRSCAVWPATHWYVESAGGCPWCTRTRDPFPSEGLSYILTTETAPAPSDSPSPPPAGSARRRPSPPRRKSEKPPGTVASHPRAGNAQKAASGGRNASSGQAAAGPDSRDMTRDPDSVAEILATLADLRDGGAITESEFRAREADLLASPTPERSPSRFAANQVSQMPPVHPEDSSAKPTRPTNLDMFLLVLMAWFAAWIVLRLLHVI
jgi:serine/threonine protein kinase